MKGYDYDKVGASPLNMQDLELLKKTLLFSADDERYLKLAGEVLKDQTNAILDVWYGFVGTNPHLLHYFTHNEEPNAAYLAAVRERFGQWIMDLCTKPYNQTWLNYQHEIALRHHTTKKNKTDGVNAVPIIHLRYITAFISPLTITIRPFLQKGNAKAEDVEGMYIAWFKAVTLTAILWSYPYIRENQF